MSGAKLFDYQAYAVLCKKHGETRFMLEPSEHIPLLRCPRCGKQGELRTLAHGVTNRKLPVTERWLGETQRCGWVDLRTIAVDGDGDD